LLKAIKLFTRANWAESSSMTKAMDSSDARVESRDEAEAVDPCTTGVDACRNILIISIGRRACRREYAQLERGSIGVASLVNLLVDGRVIGDVLVIKACECLMLAYLELCPFVRLHRLPFSISMLQGMVKLPFYFLLLTLNTRHLLSEFHHHLLPVLCPFLFIHQFVLADSQYP